MFWGDELQVLNRNQADELIDITAGFIGKSDPFIIFTGTAGKPGDMLDMIFQERDDSTIYQRFKHDYTHARGNLLSEADLQKAMRTRSFNREFGLISGWASGTVFMADHIQQCIIKQSAEGLHSSVVR